MNVHVYYPQTTSERYAPGVVRVGTTFTWFLFQPERLREVTHLSFKEYLEGIGKSLDGLDALVEYRLQFGRPILHRVNMYMVPPSKAAVRLDGSDQQFEFEPFFELIFDIVWEDLPPEVQEALPPGTSVPITLRMREPYNIRALTSSDEPVAGVEIGELMVFGRSYWPFLERAMGAPHDQHAFVGRQIAHFVKYRTPAATSGLWVPAWQAYNQIMDGDHFDSDPTVN